MLHVKLSQVYKPTLESISELVCEQFGVTQKALRGLSTKRELSDARHTFFYLAVSCTNRSKREISRYLNRNDTAAGYAKDKIQGMLDVGDPFAEKVIPLQQLLK